MAPISKVHRKRSEWLRLKNVPKLLRCHAMTLCRSKTSRNHERSKVQIVQFVNPIDDLIATLDRFKACLPAVQKGGEMIVQALRGGNKILTCGNGGSAADALHLSEELVGRYLADRQSLPAVSLVADPTLLTCIGNDYGFERLFSRQVEGLGKPGDVLVIFSTSGNSENLLRALEAARERQLQSIALLGKDGGKAKGQADLEIIVPSTVTARIQEIHTLILHMWLDQVEQVFVTE